MEYPDNEREVKDKSSDVVVIESTQGPNNEWCILNTETWQAIGNGYKPERLVIRDKK